MNARPTTIVHLLWDGDLGGVQRYVNKVYSADHWEGFRHVICFFRNQGVIINSATMPSCPMYQLELKGGWQLYKVNALSHILEKEHADIIHCHCDTPAFQLQIRKFKDFGLVFTEHGDFLMRNKNKWLCKFNWKIFGSYWDRIILNSTFTMNDFIENFPHLKSRCQVLLNPLLEDSYEIREDNAQEQNVGVFCRLVPQKGVDWFLHMAAIVHRKNPQAKFHIFGDGPMREELKILARNLAMEQAVIFHGFVENPIEMMRNMSCIVIPSRIEPFGLSALEAQSVGVPVVAFKESGVAEIVKDGETGFLVPHGDLERMAEGVNAIIESPELSKKFSASAYAYTKETFSLAKHIEQLKKIYLKKDKEP